MNASSRPETFGIRAFGRRHINLSVSQSQLSEIIRFVFTLCEHVTGIDSVVLSFAIINLEHCFFIQYYEIIKFPASDFYVS